MSVANTPYLHVVAAVIRGADGRLLLSRRLAHVDQGGLWEFPGGKLQVGEARLTALARELREELGIEVSRAVPLMQVRHRYPTRGVLLDVFVVDRWRGEPQGREGQAVRWFESHELLGLDFPAANLPLVAAARLPRVCLVTPPPGPDPDGFLRGLARCLARGVRLVRMPAPTPPAAAGFGALAARALTLCREAGARLILDADPVLALDLAADGMHLDPVRLARLRERPVPREHLLSAVCPDADALARARALGVDFAFVPAALTSAPTALARLAAAAALPVYALGALGVDALLPVIAAGCVGVAGSAAIWHGDGPCGDESLAAWLAAGCDS